MHHRRCSDTAPGEYREQKCRMAELPRWSRVEPSAAVLGAAALAADASCFCNMGTNRGKPNAGTGKPPIHLLSPHLQKPEQQGSQLLQHALPKGRSMHGGWRSAFLLVAAAQAPAEAAEDEAQQQQQHVQQQPREKHLCREEDPLERA